MNHVTYPEIHTAIGKVTLGRWSDAPENAFGLNVVQLFDRQKEQVSRSHIRKVFWLKSISSSQNPPHLIAKAGLWALTKTVSTTAPGLSVFDVAKIEDGPFAEIQ